MTEIIVPPNPEWTWLLKSEAIEASWESDLGCPHFKQMCCPLGFKERLPRCVC